MHVATIQEQCPVKGEKQKAKRRGKRGKTTILTEQKMKKDGFILAEIDGKIKECKVIYSYADGRIRVEYPTFYNGRYNGIEEKTISKDEIITE